MTNSAPPRKQSSPSRPAESRTASLQIGRHLRPSGVVLLLANAVPLCGVILLGWDVLPVLVLYWFENVIIGVLNVLKMLCVRPRDAALWLGKLFTVSFFIVHYGMFTAVHGVLVLGIFRTDSTPGNSPLDPALWQYMLGTGIQFAALALALSHTFSFATNYIRLGEYRRAGLEELMGQPYGRVIVLHLVVLLGGFLTMALQTPTFGLVLLVVLKSAADLNAHQRQHTRATE